MIIKQITVVCVLFVFKPRETAAPSEADTGFILIVFNEQNIIILRRILQTAGKVRNAENTVFSFYYRLKAHGNKARSCLAVKITVKQH